MSKEWCHEGISKGWNGFKSPIDHSLERASLEHDTGAPCHGLGQTHAYTFKHACVDIDMIRQILSWQSSIGNNQKNPDEWVYVTELVWNFFKSIERKWFYECESWKYCIFPCFFFPPEVSLRWLAILEHCRTLTISCLSENLEVNSNHEDVRCGGSIFLLFEVASQWSSSW